MPIKEKINNIDLPKTEKRSLEQRLEAFPKLKKRVESLLAITENAGDAIEKANEAEARVIQEIRQMGHEALSGWAENQAAKKEREVEKNDKINKPVKKKCIGTPPMEK